MTRPNWDASEHDPDAKHDVRGHSDDDRTDRDIIEHRPNRAERGTRLSAAIVVLGIVAIGGTLAGGLEVASGHLWNGLLVGTILVVAGAYNYYRRANEEFGSVGVASLAAICGLWLAVSPFLIGGITAVGEISAWTTVLAGVLAFALGTYSAVSVRKRRRDADARSTAVYDRRRQ